jgi:hypothetical protein
MQVKEDPILHSSDPSGLALVAPNGIKERLAKSQSPDTSGISALILEAFPEDPRMLQVAIAESQLVETAKSPKSTAKGIFQVLDGTWRAYGCTGDVLKAEDNIACAKVIHSIDGFAPWAASGPW